MTTPFPYASSFGIGVLSAWLAANDVSPPALSRALDVPRASVAAWLRGEYRPDAASREKIARFTRDGVPTSVWLLDKERAEILAVVPFERPVAAASPA